MRLSKIKVIVTLCIVAVFALSLTGCKAAKGAYEKLNEKIDQIGTAASTLSDEVVRPPQVEVPSSGDADVTVLVFMNGSNLETDSGEATEDIAEMIAGGYTENVNILIQTMGTKKWWNYNISSRRTQRYQVVQNDLKLVDDSLGYLSPAEAGSLSSFVEWGAKNYPASRYELIFWDHGAGPVYGFGYDELGDEDDTLTLDEMQSALSDAGVYFDFIGMDCCLMSSLEVCCALRDYCDYTILSEDFESGLGWSYTNWVKKLRRDPTISTEKLGQVIIDDMVTANERNTDYGDNAILTMVDEGMMKVLFSSWVDFAYANEDALLGKNYSTELSRARGGRDALLAQQRGMFSDWLYSDLDYYGSAATYDMSDYYVTDILATAQTIKSTESQALSAALAEAIVYSRSTDGDANLSGLSVTLPYGDREFYNELKTVFSNCGLDSEYITWLGKFVDTGSAYDFADFSNWENRWDGWESGPTFSYDWESWGQNSNSYNNGHNYWDWDSFTYDDYIEMWQLLESMRR